MSEKKNSVRVTIVGEEYTIRSDATPAHTRAVAEHVDRAIRHVMNTATVVETHKAAILAALQITDELFRARRVRGAGGLHARPERRGAPVAPAGQAAGRQWGAADRALTAIRGCRLAASRHRPARPLPFAGPARSFAPTTR